MACMNSVLLFALIASAATVSGFEFDVGGGIGWRKPTGQEPGTYNEWAMGTRFHIGDSIHFKYRNDSVLEVSRADYLSCEASSPIAEFDNGDTVFEFKRSGFFYFISGQADHCKSGQHLIVDVMHPLEDRQSPAQSPAKQGDAGGSKSGELGPPANSTTKLSVVSSYFVTAFIGLLVIFYVFM